MISFQWWGFVTEGEKKKKKHSTLENKYKFVQQREESHDRQSHGKNKRSGI